MNNRDLIVAVYKNVHANSTLDKEEIDEELADGLYSVCSSYFEQTFISRISLDDLLEYLDKIYGAKNLIEELNDYV